MNQSMKMGWKLGLAVSCCISIIPVSAEAIDIHAIRVNDFLNSLGVNTKILQGQDPVKLVPVLKYLGVRIVRDAHIPDMTKFITLHQQTGVMFDVLSGSGPTDITIPDTIASAKQLASAGALLAIEGPNDPNNFGLTYQGKTCCNGGVSWGPVAKFQRDFYAAIKADPVLKNYPVFGVSNVGAEQDNQGLQFNVIPVGGGTLMPDGTKYADFANDHNYVSGNGVGYINGQAWKAASMTHYPGFDGAYGEQEVTWNGGFLGYSPISLRALPRVTTETGFITDDTPAKDDIQGKILLNVYLDQFHEIAQWKYTFVYQAVDFGGGPSFGLYKDYNTPRKAAVYLHNFTTFLADTSSAFTPGTIYYKLPSKADTTHDKLMQKSTGKFELVIWGEKTIGSVMQTVGLGSTYPSVKVYDPVMNSVANFNNVSSVVLTISDHPVIIEFGP